MFDLEDKVMNACVDYVNIHDGSSTGSASLNSAPLCREAAADNYTSTGNQLTVYFKTDSTGARHGFDFIIVAITTGNFIATLRQTPSLDTVHSSA